MEDIAKYEIRVSWSEKAKIEADTTRRAPVSSKPPPPKPPITYSSDKPVGKGAEKRERMGRWKFRLKRERPQEK